MRLLMGVLAGCPFEATLVGDPSLSRRPMERVAGPLRRMGAIVETTDGPHGKGRPPVRVRGGALRAIDFASETASAQVKSAVLLAGAAAAGVTIVRESARSRDHTERMLRLFGVDVIEDGLSVSLSGPCELEGAGVSVPGDISSAAFFLAAAAGLPGSRVVLRDVGVNPTRTGVLDVLERMGAPTTRLAEEELGFEPVADLALHGPEKLTATRIAGDEVPRLIDELVVLAVLATQAHGTTEIRDARELRVKETDRIEETAALIRALGGAAETHPDGLTIRGPQRLAGGRVDAKGDHRLAMAAAVGGLFATGPTEIHGAQAAAVSYPRFFEDLTSLAPLEV